MVELCLTLLCPPALEEKLLDLLLLAPEAAVFTSAPTAAHGLAFGRLSATEQVLGRALATQIQVLLGGKHVGHVEQQLAAFARQRVFFHRLGGGLNL